MTQATDTFSVHSFPQGWYSRSLFIVVFLAYFRAVGAPDPTHTHSSSPPRPSPIADEELLRGASSPFARTATHKKPWHAMEVGDISQLPPAPACESWEDSDDDESNAPSHNN